MGDGIKAWAEEAQEQALRKQIEAFKNLDPANTAVALSKILDDLQRLQSCGTLQLTKYNWILLDNSVKSLRAILHH